MQDRNLFALKEGNDAVMEHIGCNQCVFPIIQFGKCHFGIGVNDGLLVDSSNPLHVTDIEGILSNQATGIFRFNLSSCLLFCFWFFQGLELRLRQMSPSCASLASKAFKRF